MFDRYRQELEEILEKGESHLEVMLKVNALLTEAMSQAGLRPIVVGGLAVEIYTQGDYTTRDIDWVLSGRDRAGEILEQLGFSKERGERHWFRERGNLAIEIPDSFLAGREDHITEIELRSGRKIFVIGIEDLIMDRIRSCIHWDSSSDCEWAERLFALHYRDLDLTYLLEQAAEEGAREKVVEWRERYAVSD